MQYGCLAGYSNATFKGNRSITRFDVAALLQSCLFQITEATDETRPLILELDVVLSIIRERVDVLESRFPFVKINSVFYRN